MTEAVRGHMTEAETVTETVLARGHVNVVRVFDEVIIETDRGRGHVIAILPVLNPQEMVEVIENGTEIVFEIVTIVGHMAEAVEEVVLGLVQDHQKTAFVVRGQRLTRPSCWPLLRKMPLDCLVQIT